MITTANVYIRTPDGDRWFHRPKDGFLAIVGADLLRVIDGMEKSLDWLKYIGRPSRPVVPQDVINIFKAWDKFYQPFALSPLADLLIGLDLDRKDGDWFGRAEVGEFQGPANLRDNLQWFPLDQFRSQVNADRARLDRYLADMRREDPGAFPGLDGFPSI